jgi:GNAT superfamily N-acetyltransferase
MGVLTKPTITWNLRRASLDDLPQLQSLLEELFGKIEPDFLPDADRTGRGLRLFFKHPDRGAIYCAWQGIVCIGMASGQLLFSTGAGGLSLLVEDVIVVKSSRGHGVASALLVALEDWARAMGVRRFELRIDKENGAARAFYQRRGWFETRMEWMRK